MHPQNIDGVEDLPDDIREQLKAVSNALGGGPINPFCPPMESYLSELSERERSGEDVTAQIQRVEQAAISATPLLVQGGSAWCDHIAANMK